MPTGSARWASVPRAGVSPGAGVRKLLAATTGGASGFVGVPGIAADLPLTTCLMMRSIAEIARSHGEDLTSADTRQACIEVFAFGGPDIGDEDIDVAYWTIRGGLNHASISLLIRQVAARFGVMLSQKYLAQAVPLIGAAAGGTLNYVFMDYYQRMAQVHFTLRELERRHDPDAVHACFDSLVARRGRGAAGRPLGLLPAEARMLDHTPPEDGGREWTGRRRQRHVRCRRPDAAIRRGAARGTAVVEGARHAGAGARQRHRLSDQLRRAASGPGMADRPGRRARSDALVHRHRRHVRQRAVLQPVEQRTIRRWSPSSTTCRPSAVRCASMFGIERVACVYGWSMGALQAYHWAALFPDAVERIVVNCGVRAPPCTTRCSCAA